MSSPTAFVANDWQANGSIDDPTGATPSVDDGNVVYADDEFGSVAAARCVLRVDATSASDPTNVTIVAKQADRSLGFSVPAGDVVWIGPFDRDDFERRFIPVDSLPFTVDQNTGVVVSAFVLPAIAT